MRSSEGLLVDPTIIINERVDVIARFGASGVAYPAKIRYQGREISFTKLALKHPTAKGRRMIHVFDVSDGANDYRLEFDAEALTWTLAAMIPGDRS